MAKLFHHLVIEQDIKNAWDKIKNETLKVFEGRSHFEGLIKNYQPKDDKGDPFERQEKEVVTTVPERLRWTRKMAEKLVDCEFIKDVANLCAVSDLVVEGEVIAEKVPATFLLSLEKRLLEIRNYYDKAPTLDMSRDWKDSAKAEIYKYGPTEQYRTAKKTVSVELSPATKEFPAQVKAVTEDMVIGTWETTYFSGAISPKDKAKWLERIDVMYEAVKIARQRANDVPVTDNNVAKKIFDFIHKGD